MMIPHALHSLRFAPRPAVAQPEPWTVHVRVYDDAGREVAFGGECFAGRGDGEEAIDAAIERAIAALYKAGEGAKLGLAMGGALGESGCECEAECLCEQEPRQ